MLASVIVVAHGHLPYLRGCIRRLAAHTQEYELIVVDNGSDSETVRFIKGLEEQGVASRTVINSENLGYAAGCNQGIRLSSCQHVVLLHTDCFVTPDWLLKLTRHFRHRDGFRMGAVVPVTNYANESFPVYDAELRDRFVEYKLPNKSDPDEDEVESVLNHTYPGGLDQFSGAIEWRTPLVYSTEISSFCTAFSRDVFDECGFFDEAYEFRGYEDMDFYMRMREAGFEVWSARDCFVHHFGNISSDGEGFCFPEVMRRNRERFERVWAPSRVE